MAKISPIEIKQYPLFVFLTYLYMQPYSVSNFLRRHNIYEGFMSEIVTVKF